VRNTLDLRLGPGDNRDGAAFDGLPDEILTVECRAFECAEDASLRDLAMID
jgi:hypothetical protein